MGRTARQHLPLLLVRIPMPLMSRIGDGSLRKNAGLRMRSSWHERRLRNGSVDSMSLLLLLYSYHSFDNAYSLFHSGTVNKVALHYYMNFFDFSGLRLDVAFRRLCAKLYLKAETQQVDRILEEFSRRYWETNPNTVYGSASELFWLILSSLRPSRLIFSLLSN